MQGHCIMDFLGLGAFRFMGMDEWDDRIVLHVETKSTEWQCPCGAVLDTLYDHRPARAIRAETVRNKPVFLRVAAKRWGPCKVCDTITQEPSPYVDAYARQTVLFADKIRDRALRHPATEVALEERLPYSSVRARLAEAVDQWEQPPVDWTSVKRIGIDEFANKKRQRYYLIVVDLDTHRPIGVLPQRSKLHLKAWLLQIRELGCTLEAVAIDMWAPYADVVQEVFSQAQTVIDPFHVVKHVVEAMNDVRKRVQRSFPEKHPCRKEVWNLRGKLYANREELPETEWRQLDTVLDNYPELKEAYWLKEEFRSWYRDAGTRASEGLRLWMRKVKRSAFESFQKVAGTIKRWREKILNFFAYGISNGVTEGINNKIKALKRACYGRLSFRNLRARILFNCRGLEPQSSTSHA